MADYRDLRPGYGINVNLQVENMATLGGLQRRSIGRETREVNGEHNQVELGRRWKEGQ